MITIQDTELKDGVLEAIDRARKLSRPVLVSEVQKINHLEPLSFFTSGKEAFLGERFFWKDVSNETYIIGLGICKQIQSDQAADRFFHVETEWQRLMEHAYIQNRFQEPATGPIIFGGFSFDPVKEKSSLWSKYGDSLFYVPKYMLSLVNGQVFLTTNVICTQHDDGTIISNVINERNKLLSTFSIKTDYEEIILKGQQEVHPEQWRDTVTQVVDDLKTGDMKKVVLARELRLFFEHQIEVEEVISNLLDEQKASFIFAFESEGDCFVGASPERLVKKQGKELFSTCLAGSIARGSYSEEDEQLGQMLLNDQKNLVEHQYVVDMIKHAMEQVCDSVTLPDKPVLMKMRDIQHLYTPVEGRSNDPGSLLRLVKRLHPTPALGGLPTEEAIKKIRTVEELDRGFYAAPIGWMDFKGNGEFAVAIRSALIQNNEASLFAGCGIVKESDAESEYIETKIKFRPMLSALGGMKK